MCRLHAAEFISSNWSLRIRKGTSFFTFLTKSFFCQTKISSSSSWIGWLGTEGKSSKEITKHGERFTCFLKILLRKALKYRGDQISGPGGPSLHPNGCKNIFFKFRLNLLSDFNKDFGTISLNLYLHIFGIIFFVLI